MLLGLAGSPKSTIFFLKLISKQATLSKAISPSFSCIPIFQSHGILKPKPPNPIQSHSVSFQNVQQFLPIFNHHNHKGSPHNFFWGDLSQICLPTHPRVFVRFGRTKGEIRVKNGDFWGDLFFLVVWTLFG